MSKLLLKAQKREVVGRGLEKFRKQGKIPAVIYGNKIESRNLFVDNLDFSKAYSKAGENTILELSVDGEEKVNVLIHDIQINPLSGNFSHVDFFQVRMDEKIEAHIPIEFFGESVAVKALGGILVKNIEEIPVSCLPADLPHSFKVDLEKLKSFDDHISVNDIEVSERVKVMVDGETIVATVTPPRSEDELKKLDEKVEEDVSKVQGVIRETPTEETGEKKGK